MAVIIVYKFVVTGVVGDDGRDRGGVGVTGVAERACWDLTQFTNRADVKKRRRVSRCG